MFITQWRIVSAEALRENLTPLLDVARGIEEDALKDVHGDEDDESPGQGARRVRQLTAVIPKLIFMARWQVRSCQGPAVKAG